MSQVFNVNISGDVANLANGSQDFSQVASISVSHGNISQLHQALEQAGVPKAEVVKVQREIEELELRLAGDDRKESKLFYVKELANKIAIGIKNVSTEVASSVLAKVISGYIG